MSDARDFFHYGIIYGVARAILKRIFVYSVEVMIFLAAFERAPARSRHGFIKMRDSIQPHRCLHHEHTAIPQVVARRDIPLSRFLIGFLNKLLDPVARQRVERHFGFDIAIPCFGRCGDDTEGDYVAFVGERGAVSHCMMKRRVVLDNVIGREHQ